MMLWNILRPRFWEMRHMWAGMSLSRRILSILGLLVISGFVLSVFILMIIGLTGARGKGYLAALLPTSFFTMIFFMIIQLGDTLQQLYLAPDLFWLNQAPLRKLDVYLAKLIECTFSLWLPTFFFLGMLIALGVAQNAPFLYYPLIVCIILALLALVTVSGMLIIMLLARIIPVRRMRELFPVLMGVVSIGGFIAQQAFLARFHSNTPSIEILTTSLQNIPQMLLVSIVAVTAAGIWAAGGYFVFSAVNEQALNAIQTAQPPKARRSSPLSSPAVPALPDRVDFFAYFFPAEQLNIMIKDWITLRRDPQRATNLVLTPLMVIIFMLPSFGWQDFSSTGYWLMLFYAAMFSMNSGQGIALPSFTQEARVFSFIYRSPVSMRSVMAAKLWAAWIPAALIWSIVLCAGALFMHLPLWQWAVINTMVLVCLAGTCIVMVGISALSADLAAISPRPKLTGPMAWVAMLVGLFWNFCVLGITCSLILFLAADNPLVTGMLSTLDVPTIPSFVPLLAALICLLGLVAATIPITWFWLSGLKRLNNWEQT
jgi:hypothetical protein